MLALPIEPCGCRCQDCLTPSPSQTHTDSRRVKTWLKLDTNITDQHHSQRRGSVSTIERKLHIDETVQVWSTVAVTFENNANKCMQTMSHISNYRRHVDPADKDSCAPGQAPTRSDQHEMQDNQKANDVIISEIMLVRVLNNSKSR